MKTKNHIICLSLVIILVIYSFMLGGCSKEEPLNENEKYVANMVTVYRQVLKDPDSMKIRGTIGIIRFENGYEYIVAKIAGNNSYGASNTSTPIWVNGSFFNTFEYVTERSDEIKNMSTSGLSKDELLDILSEKIVLAFTYNAIKDYYSSGKGIIGSKYGTGSEDSIVKTVEIVDGKKIAKAIGCEYSEY